ncbi:FadR/GntR family transcriptional regulator [Burkholderia sp. MR1-5-21]
MPFQTIEPQRLYRQIASQIAGLIDAGEFSVGERLPAERDLSARLGVSRSTVREALIALEIEGVVEVRSGSGVYVLRREPHIDLRSGPHLSAQPASLGPFDVIRARAYLETEIAVQAVRNATEEQIARVRECLEKLRYCVVGEPELIPADRSFHMRIAEASGNGAYVLLLETLWEHRTAPLYYQLENHFLSSKVWKQSMMEHEEIFAALVARDEKRIAKAMQAHMHNAEERLNSKFE